MKSKADVPLEKCAPIPARRSLLYLALMTPGVDPITTDWAMYVMHARNIATGHSYANTLYVYQPETAMYGAATYPTGYSLLLAPIGFPRDEQYLSEAIWKAQARFDAVYQNARLRLMRYQPDASAN